MPRITGRKIYHPANAQTNPVPHTEKPTATKAILTTNFMLIGRLLPCFLFFSILLIISDFFLCRIGAGVLTLCFGYIKRSVYSVEEKFLANKYARPKHEGKRKIFHKPIWRRDSPEYLCIPNMGSDSTPPIPSLNEEEIIWREV